MIRLLLQPTATFLLGVFFASAVFVHAAEESSVVSVIVGNALPQVSSVVLSNVAYGSAAFFDGITPSVATSTFHITGIAIDHNGENNIATTTAVFYRTNLTATSSCSAFLKNCYRTNCAIDTSYGSASQVRYNCPIDLASWADATDSGSAYDDTNWTVHVTASDLAGTYTIATSTVEVNSLLALEVPATFEYDALAVGATTTAENAREMIVTQGGNVAATINVHGTDLSCSIAGFIPVQNQHWSLSRTGWDSESSFPLATTATSTELYLARRVSLGTVASSSLFFTIKIPDTNVGGICTGLIYVNAIASTNVGTLVDSPVKGVRYTSRKNANGITRENGTFTRLPDDTVTFSIGTAILGTISRNGATQNEFIFPQDLVGVAHSNVEDARVTRIARFLQSLDEDLDASNGIQVPDKAQTSITHNNLNIQTANDALLRNAVRNVYPGRNLVPVQEAQDHLRETTRRFNPEAFLEE